MLLKWNICLLFWFLFLSSFRELLISIHLPHFSFFLQNNLKRSEYYVVFKTINFVSALFFSGFLFKNFPLCEAKLSIHRNFLSLLKTDSLLIFNLHISDVIFVCLLIRTIIYFFSSFWSISNFSRIYNFFLI